MAKPAEQVDTTMDNTPFFYKWQKGEGIPVVETFFIKDLKEVPLKWWDRMGGDGTLFNMEGAGDATGAYIVEIAPGKSLNPMRHLYEELILVVQGRGATTIWNDNGAKQTFEWQEGSLISVPLNVHHQHFNGQGDKPARLFSVNNMPIVFSLFHNDDFIFNTPYDFADRFDGRPGLLLQHGHAASRPHLGNQLHRRHAHLQPPGVEGARRGRQERLPGDVRRHHGGAHLRVPGRDLQEGAPPRARLQRHHHQGQGFSLFWWEGEEPKRYDWQDGSVFVPPESMFHQHFNLGPTGARYLPLRFGGIKHSMGENYGDISKVDKDVKSGGNQIEYYDQPAYIREMFEADMGNTGATSRMDAGVYVKPAA